MKIWLFTNPGPTATCSLFICVYIYIYWMIQDLQHPPSDHQNALHLIEILMNSRSHYVLTRYFKHYSGAASICTRDAVLLHISAYTILHTCQCRELCQETIVPSMCCAIAGLYCRQLRRTKLQRALCNLNEGSNTLVGNHQRYDRPVNACY